MPKEGARQRVHMALDYILELTSPDHSGVRYWVPARCVFQSAPEPLCCLLLECDVSSELVVMSHVVDRGMARILPQNRAIGLFKFNIVLLQLSILTSVMKTWTGWQGQIIEAGPAAALFRFMYISFTEHFAFISLARKLSRLPKSEVTTYPIAVVTLKVLRICEQNMISTWIWAACWPYATEHWTLSSAHLIEMTSVYFSLAKHHPEALHK